MVMLDDKLEGVRFRNVLIPITQQEGLHLKFAQSVNFHPVATVGDLENYLRRLRGFPPDSRGHHRRDASGNGREARPAPGHDGQGGPPTPCPGDVPGRGQPPLGDCRPVADGLGRDGPRADRRRGPQGDRGIGLPGLRMLARFVAAEYVPACRESVGLWDSPDGDAHYAYRARSFTTTTLTPDEIHAIGLAEIAKIREAMEAIRVKVGFQGDLDDVLPVAQDRPEVPHQR